MAVPKKKTSKSKTNMRRSHIKEDQTNYVLSKTTGEMHRNHHIDSRGFYKGRKVRNVVEKDLESNEQD